MTEMEEHIGRFHEKRKLEKRLNNSEKRGLQYKIGLMTTLGKLKEVERGEKSTCQCRGMCRITHTKHNWKRWKADEFISNLSGLEAERNPNVHSCVVCKSSFKNISNLKEHKLRKHSRTQFEINFETHVPIEKDIFVSEDHENQEC